MFQKDFQRVLKNNLRTVKRTGRDSGKKARETGRIRKNGNVLEEGERTGSIRKLRFLMVKVFFSEKAFKFESSILAQDERWRRA